MKKADVIIIGAGAAGLMCAIEAGKRGRRVIVLDQSNKPGKKILMSGGGRCNFTNYQVTADNFISHNPNFCKSALSRYTQWDFIALVESYKIAYHEKTLGQLFCDNKSKDILNLLLAECERYGVTIQLNTDIQSVEVAYRLQTTTGEYCAQSLVVASGGLSIPTMGSSPFGYQLAKQFGLKVWPTRAGLVPFTLHEKDKAQFSVLSGISAPATVSTECATFKESILLTHRGLSGPAILQASSYWSPGEMVKINLLPELDLASILIQAKKATPKLQLKTVLASYIPKRMITAFVAEHECAMSLADFSHQQVDRIAAQFQEWQVYPNGTEGYRTAEVTLGGVDCCALSSKTMEVNTQPGLYFIGEVVDVTGWLGGYNFQWAWSSGWAAGQCV